MRGSRRSGLSLARAWYEKTRVWVVYASAALVVVVLYLGSFLGPARDWLLPAAAGVLTAFAVQSLQIIERQTAPAHPVDVAEARDAVPALSELVARDRETTDLRIIAATGWTTVREILPPLLAASRAAHVNVELHIVDPDGPYADTYPAHWTSEVQNTLARARSDLNDPRLRVTVCVYDYLPAVHGILVDSTHLLIGFFGWVSSGGRPELVGSQRTHRLYHHGDPGSDQFFDIFDEWFRHAPRRTVLELPENVSAGDGPDAPA